MARTRSYPLVFALLLLAFGTVSAVAQPLDIDFGNVELGQIQTTCVQICFGQDCSGTGTVNSASTTAPFFVRGERVGFGGSPCSATGSTDPVNLPVTLQPGEILALDVDLVPLDLGPLTNLPFFVNGVEEAQLSADVQPIFTCQPTISALCLQEDRFKTRVHWRTDFGTRGAGRSVSGVAPDDSGLFYFFSPSNWEMLIKVLDACTPQFEHFWVFAAATTNVEYTITVVDTQTQEARSYFKPQGPPAPAITDTQAFATCP